MSGSSKLYPGEVVIDTDKIWQHGDPESFKETATPDGMSTGYALERRRTPFGAIEKAPAFSLPQIPSSEYQARIKEMEELGSSISQRMIRAGIPSKDQQQTNFCHVEGTEVLTEKGWVDFSNYNGTDLLATMNPVTQMMEYQAPIKNHVFDHDSEIIYSTHKRVEFGVTPNHRMLVRKWDESKRKLSDDFTFTTADKMGWYCGLPHAPKGFIGTDYVELAIEGDRSYDGDDFIAMISLIVSDGWAGGVEKTKNAVSFACFADHRYEMVKALAYRVGFKEQPGRKGVYTRWDAGALAEWIRKNCYHSSSLGATSKKIPDFIKWASSRQIKHFLTMYGDQNHKKDNGHYFSTSKRLIDDLQELCLRVGKRGFIYTTEPKDSLVESTGQIIHANHKMYHLNVAVGEQLSIDKKENIEKEHYKGPVYCATVPNSTLITRRKGGLLISGNCWMFSTTSAYEARRMLQGETYINFSPASCGGILTNGRNVGGWCEQAIKGIDEYGLAPDSMWNSTQISGRRPADLLKKMKTFDVPSFAEVTPNSLPDLMTAGLSYTPLAVGLSWWSHAILFCEPVWLDGAVAYRFRNSWGASYGSNGFSILQGRKMIPDDCIAVLSVSPADVGDMG